MNYIWDVMLKADSQDIKREEIRFKKAESCSPYMELSFKYLNQSELEYPLVVEINPYYRFFSIFKEIFDPDMGFKKELRESVFDITVHYLARQDLRQGMSRHEYYSRFIERDIENGVFSEDIRKAIKLFDEDEKRRVVNAVWSLYKTGESIRLFKKTVSSIFPKASIYKNADRKKEIIIYMNKEENISDRKKIDTLAELFLQLDFEMLLYWRRHFGVIGVDETMKTGEMAVY